MYVDRRGADKEERKTLSFTLIVTFLNADGNQTHWLSGSPELVTAMAIAEI
jgi:hypothetical protein